jgi:hypothetical protein
VIGLDRHQRYTQVEDLPHRALGDETVVLNVRTREVHVLNGTGSHIWRLLSSAHSVDQLLVALGAEFGLDPTTAEPEVTAFVGELLEKGLVIRAGGEGS